MSGISVRLVCASTAILLLGVGSSGCQFHSWSRYSKVPYQRWRADDTARLELLREIARGCTAKAKRLSRGPGYYQLRMSSRWARKARVAHEAVRLLEASPANPRPGCARILSKLRWRLDNRYPCAVGWVTSLFIRTYLRSSPARRADLRRRIRRMGYHCGPHHNWEGIFLGRLRRASPCLVARQPAAVGAPGTTPGPIITPPPAPGHAPTPGHAPAPSPAPPRKKRTR